MGNIINTQPLPQSFINKKAHILAELANPSETYADKSLKGTVDSQVVELIRQVNSLQGYVTTSSCAGRVSVFAEGRKSGGGSDVQGLETEGSAAAGPGGKGFGSRWLYVSHEPIELHANETWAAKLGLGTDTSNLGQVIWNKGVKPTETSRLRLIRLSFSPLILHIACASLQHAKPLLAAAINAGFRESGIQSLKALDDPEAHVMLAMRCAGLTFETVVGYLEVSEDGEETARCCVTEEYLSMCMGVINERFRWNEERRKRLQEQIKRSTDEDEWEDPEERRRRKREEGLRLRAHKAGKEQRHEAAGEEPDVLTGVLSFDFI